MANEQKNKGGNGKAVETANANSIPSEEQVKDWVRKDLQAAHYFLGLLLRYPDAIDKAAAEIYKDVKIRENGAAIDHVNSPEHATS